MMQLRAAHATPFFACLRIIDLVLFVIIIIIVALS